jgi:hypothetical protein
MGLHGLLRGQLYFNSYYYRRVSPPTKGSRGQTLGQDILLSSNRTGQFHTGLLLLLRTRTFDYTYQQHQQEQKAMDEMRNYLSTTVSDMLINPCSNMTLFWNKFSHGLRTLTHFHSLACVWSSVSLGNVTKCVQATFTLKKEQCPAVHINNTVIPQSPTAKYLGLQLDSRLTWTQHIEKREQIRPKSKRIPLDHRKKTSRIARM